ncbi:glycosyltransferase [Agrobacterium fabrum]|uniref:glycosyltransferase n=1 Tax=Agrobacterium fabrum TaxID=1176649 RepID=UPI00247328AF|nr:glycosyltransferase [Agrobacterium fabrum]MDH6296599.1 GT2 family glycosyltransferase [Agrobacterium fabrum]
MRFLNVPFGEPDFYDPYSEWLQYGPFGMWLIHALRPRRVVELGTCSGFSYFSFCQAVVEGNIEAECLAISQWQNEQHAAQSANDFFEQALSRNKPYAGFSNLLRKTTADALDYIADGSIDFLSLIGSHFSNEIMANWEKWNPKLSARAVVVFQGTKAYEGEPEKGTLFQDICATCPAINLPNGSGVRVLFFGKEIVHGVKPLLQLIGTVEGHNAAVDYFCLAGERYLSRVLRHDVATEAEAAQPELTVDQRMLLEKSEHDKLERDFARREARYKLAIAVKALTSDVELLEHSLKNARTKPLVQIRDNLIFKVLSFFAGFSPPLSRRTARRLERSAAKRNPLRNDLEPWRRVEAPYVKVISEWLAQRKNMAADLSELAGNLQGGPIISLLVPVCNPSPSLLAELIESIIAQSYRGWELYLVSDRSNGLEVRRTLESYVGRDKRIQVFSGKEDADISQTTNDAIEAVSGKYLALLGHDDLLDSDALLFVVQVIEAHPDVRIIYTDEDKVREDGTRYDPHFKPDWNRELLYGMNYISNLGVYDVEMVRNAGAFRPGFEGAEKYDLLLRSIESVNDNQIRHVSKVLYSRRDVNNNFSASNQSETFVANAGQRALEEHFSRTTGKAVPVIPGNFPLSYRALWPLEAMPLVSIIIPTRDHLDVLRVAVESILDKTDYRNIELIIVDNQSVEQDTLTWLEWVKDHDSRVRVIRDERPFNYSALNNNAVTQCRGEIVALVNNDVEVISTNWLSEMVALAQREKTGCVGAKLLYPNGRVQHAGVIVGMGGIAGHGHQFFSSDDSGYFGRLMVRQNYSAVTAACLVVRKEIYERVGGLNETDLAVAFNDVDFCLKVQEAGYNNVWTPYALLYHYESISRGPENTPEKRERFQREVHYMHRRWQSHRFPDPAYNPNLSLEAIGFVMASPRWAVDDIKLA